MNEEEKDIEESKSYEYFEGLDDYIEYLKNKINELIREVNKLKNKKTN